MNESIPQYPQYQQYQQPYAQLPQQNPYNFSSTLDILKSDDYIVVLRHLLQGEIYDDVNKVYISFSNKPILNDKGISAIMFAVASYTTKVFGTSDYEKRDITFITHLVTDDIIDLIEHNWREYEMDRSHRDLVVNLVRDSIHAELRGSLDAGKRTALFATNIISENRTYNPPVEQPKSIIPNPMAGLRTIADKVTGKS